MLKLLLGRAGTGKTRALLESNACAELKDAAQKWLDTMEDGAANAEATKNYIAALEDGLVTVDELAAFAASDAGKQLFGDKQGEVVSHAQALKAEGKIRHVGISFHDRAEVLEEILTTYPQIEVVQIQFNYVDYDDPAVQSRECYEVCRRHGKPVLVMEPVKGGNLVNLPEEARKVLDELHGGSPASYAIRFAAGFPGMMMVLSGMSSMEQMKDNLSYMKDFQPLNETELEAVKKVQSIFRGMNLIPCTACRYCTDGCPRQIAIPDLFAVMNTKQIYHDWNADFYYNNVYTGAGRRASDCIQCGRCEKACPQHLPIRRLLTEIAAEFEKQ